jgi:transposase-like protein
MDGYCYYCHCHRNPYDAEVRNKVIALCKQGLPYRAIARETGISHETVSRWCREAGIARKIGRARVVTPEQRQRILTLYENTGLNFSQIARAVDLPRTTVRDIIKYQDPNQ